MKKAIAIAVTICILLCMTGCASQGDLDAAVAERDSLRAERDALQATVDKYTDIIGAMEAGEYETAMAIITEKQIAQKTAEMGDFTANIVTVELTAENVAEYLEFRPYEIEYLDAFGNGTGQFDCGVALSSKVFDSGLVYWSSENIGIEILFADNYGSCMQDLWQKWSVYSSGSQVLGWEKGSTVVDIPLGAVVYGFSNDVTQIPDFHPELLRFGNAKGTITFVKAEYVESISNEGGRTVSLIDGQSEMTGYWCNGVDWPDNILG